MYQAVVYSFSLLYSIPLHKHNTNYSAIDGLLFNYAIKLNTYTLHSGQEAGSFVSRSEFC